jgi:PAS domain S-box-containing protein
MEEQKIESIIMHNLPVGFSLVDKDGSIVEFNPAEEEITGYSRDEVTGRPHFEILHGAADRSSCPLIEHALSQKVKTVATEAEIKKKNGEQIVLSVTAFLFTTAGTLWAPSSSSGTLRRSSGWSGSARISCPCSPTI